MGRRFAQALLDRDFATAHALTSSEYRGRVSPAELQEEFERSVPPDWRGGFVEVGEPELDWRGKRPTDVAMVYVCIGGDVYSEAVIVVVAEEGDELTVREVEVGRP